MQSNRLDQDGREESARNGVNRSGYSPSSAPTILGNDWRLYLLTLQAVSH